MHLVNCEHPVRIYNKYLDEYMHVPCGKCCTCQNRKSSRWVARLEKERSQHLFSVFVTLTYSNAHLPVFKFNPYEMTSNEGLSRLSVVGPCYETARNGYYRCIPFSEFDFGDSADRDYLRDLHGRIPYADFSDIQLFNKRLNKWFHDHITNTYKNFRYFVVSEYGSTTHRPHFHGLYFIDSPRLAQNFAEGVRSSWKLGRVDIQLVESTASSYVAQYLNKLWDLPSFYEHKYLRPKFVCSKFPTIGGDFNDSNTMEEIFHNASVRTPYIDARSGEISDVPLLSVVENRLFPKCPRYSEIPHQVRVALYGCSSRYVAEGFQPKDGRTFEFLTFRDWLNAFRFEDFAFRHIKHGISEYRSAISKIAHNFTELGVNALKRLYYLSKRVLTNCMKFGVSLDYYVSQIEKYWDKKQYDILRSFYDFQQSFSQRKDYNIEELVHCYPEYVHQNWMYNLIPIEDCQDYKLLVSESSQIHKNLTKSHFKNAYFESLENINNPIYSRIKKFYYAKKRNEIIETLSTS